MPANDALFLLYVRFEPDVGNRVGFSLERPVRLAGANQRGSGSVEPREPARRPVPAGAQEERRRVFINVEGLEYFRALSCPW